MHEVGRMRSSLIIALAGFIAISFSAFSYEPETTATQRDYVTETLPYPIDHVYDRLLAMFSSDARAYYEDYNGAIYVLPGTARSVKDLTPEEKEKITSFPIIKPNKFYVFFAAYPNMQRVINDMTPLAAMGHSNAALQRYAALPMELRSYDLYLWSPDVPFWYSEYTLNGKSMPFRSYFILHLSPVDENHTAVEIIEDQPIGMMGKRKSVDTHGIVHDRDIREVEPTTKDREFLLSCINQFIDRQIPGRHWFNCRG
jgi:hypothetical protein